jgi:hypothetical protein
MIDAGRCVASTAADQTVCEPTRFDVVVAAVTNIPRSSAVGEYVGVVAAEIAEQPSGRVVATEVMEDVHRNH